MFVVAISNLYNCPVHDFAQFSRLQSFSNIFQLLKFIKDNLNHCKILEILKCDNITAKYELEYFSSGHKFIGCELKINGEMIVDLSDDGLGKLMWYIDDDFSDQSYVDYLESGRLEF